MVGEFTIFLSPTIMSGDNGKHRAMMTIDGKKRTTVDNTLESERNNGEDEETKAINDPKETPETYL